MKTKKTILFAGFFVLTCTVIFFSCNNPSGLGGKLDIKGPEVEFTAPAARKALPLEFMIEGTAADNQGVTSLVLKAQIKNKPFDKQWRYNKGSWEVSVDNGALWSPLDGAVWDGDPKSAVWKIPINMSVNGNAPEDGEYLFSVQAWDAGGFTDDNSFKTRVLIVDKDPPKVDVSNPYLYSKYSYDPAAGTFSDPDIQEIHGIGDRGEERFDPAMIGKFITQAFQLQWQIEDSHDVWSIELGLYPHNAQIDEAPGTPLPNDYIYRYWKNLPPPLAEPDPENTIKPNGAVLVPALDSPIGVFDDGGEIKNRIDEKTTIKVVAVCYDSAGNANQEKILGYFVYWPRADEPWITYSDGMETADYYTTLLASPEGSSYNGDLEKLLEEKAFMIYPGRRVRATAFHASGLKEVRYSLYPYDLATRTTAQPLEAHNDVLIENEPRPNGSYPTIFPWEFIPPPRTGYFVVRAKAYSTNTESLYHESATYEALFRVQDISFPNFPEEPSPKASEPLFKFIDNNMITISGVASDATEIVSLAMVWINPQSRNYAAMSQLQYFRDSTYQGWTDAKSATIPQGGASATRLEPNYLVSTDPRYPYDPNYPNRLWNIKPVYKEQDIETGRQLYTYSVPVNLSELNIVMGQQPLSSQVFLLRAENPDGKCTIITYAPQGDTLGPTITINEARVIRNGALDVVCKPGEYQQVPKFLAGDIIRVEGSWTEDSTEYLDVKDYLYPNMKFSINGSEINSTGPGVLLVERTPPTGNETSGTFTLEVEVQGPGVGTLIADSMKDTLVVNASVKDIGGNPSEDAASWLIESDTLRFLRISSLDEDQAYRVGDSIDIFLEFNKPVRLKPGRNWEDLALTLNTTGVTAGRAKYKAGQGNESTRHFFTYTVQAGQNTPAAINLNVNGLSIDGGTTALAIDSTAWQDPDYPFTWINTGLDNTVEEVRLTRTTAHSGAKPSGYDYYARALPVTDVSGSSEFPFTLAGGKRITVDNQPPTITKFSASPTGWHKAGVDIYITATFSEAVKLGDTTPWLILGTGNNGTTSTAPADIRVNNDQITFKYTVKATDTTGINQLTVTSFGGQILDVPGTAMLSGAVTGMTESDRRLTGVYLDTQAPNTPTVTVYNGLTGDTNPTEITTPSGNLYYENVFVRITGSGGDQNLGRIEYSLNGGDDWTSSTTTPINVQLLNNGPYTVQARQTDKAGNGSSTSADVAFNWDKGNLISSINSFTPNGSYTRHTQRQDSIEIQVNFRKALTFSGNQTITLNVANGASTSKTVTLTNANLPATMPTSQLTFTYGVASGDTTNNAVLDVTGLGLSAADAGTAVPANFINSLPVAGSRLADLKAIKIVTGNIQVSSGPTWTRSGTGEEWAGAISITFDREISKGSGNITITPSATGYRLPAVLDEAQSSRYRSARNFSTYYTRGTNGFINGSGPDTATKFVLNYDEGTIVTPNNTGTPIQQMAYDFRTAETVTLPVTSQDVTISGQVLTITLAGSNALQVLGAQYALAIPTTCIQDNLGWPVNNALSYTYTTAGVNKAFVRVDKQINKDTVTAASGDNTTPWLTATHVLQTRARLDCRTPGSVVRYRINEQSFSTNSVQTPDSWDRNTIDQGTIDDWRGGDFGDTAFSYLSQLVPDANNGTTYSSFTTHLTVGNGTETDGYVWRISARGRNSENGTTFSEISEEIALRTVLTVEIASMNDVEGQIRPGNGDNLWIRGGDADSSSSVPGFPLTWDDNFNNLSGKRAGIRLLRFVSTGNNLHDNSIWRWVSWEVNVRTYFNIFLGRDNVTPPDAAKAWQYGPRLRAALRGGWATKTEYYTLYPGKHRWLRIYGTSFEPGGELGFVTNFISRPDLATSMTIP